MRVIFVLSLFIVFAFNAFPQNNTDDDAIRAVIQKLVTAQADYDLRALDSIFTSDYIEISPAGEFDPRDKVLGFYKPSIRPDPAKMTAAVDVTEYSIRNYGSFAITIARFNYAMTAEGKPLPPRSIRATIVLKKDKTDWKIASAQYTGIRATPTQKTN